MRLSEYFSTQHFGKSHEIQTHFGLRQLSDAELKLIQNMSLEIYKDILDVCKRYNLIVMMGGGSVLGAVRHNGFIPWDDDMDLLMPREDYEKFKQIVGDELSHKYNINIKGKYPGIFIRIEKKNTRMTGIFNIPKSTPKGIGVDLMPIDYVPDNKMLYFIKGVLSLTLFFVIVSRRMYMGRNPLSKKYYSQSVSMRIFYYMRMTIGWVSCIVPYNRLCVWFDRFVASSKISYRCTIASGRKHYFGETLLSAVFFPAKQLKFEGVSAFVPNDYDRYLTNLYGDYMEIPPADKQERHAVVEFKV